MIIRFYIWNDGPGLLCQSDQHILTSDLFQTACHGAGYGTLITAIISDEREYCMGAWLRDHIVHMTAGSYNTYDCGTFTDIYIF